LRLKKMGEVRTESCREYILEEIDRDSHHKWYNRAGQLHRDGDMPALIHANGSKSWYRNGKLHRDGDMPAFIGADGAKSWHKNGKLYRDGGVRPILFVG
jgi:antitoxin component YwqK of YwqJK toxin-antitoxin module